MLIPSRRERLLNFGAAKLEQEMIVDVKGLSRNKSGHRHGLEGNKDTSLLSAIHLL